MILVLQWENIYPKIHNKVVVDVRQYFLMN